jgi:hypothetical protein
MRKLCSEITPGMSIEKLSKISFQNGLNKPREAIGTTFLVETKTFGRWGCKVDFEKGLVSSSEYNFAD